MIKYKMC